jgi:polyisoprenoid-binding protein YceI
MRSAILVMLAAVRAFAQDAAIDTTRSTVTIHVGKTGLLSSAGHEHWVSAPISSGTLRESPEPSVEFTIETARMTVKPDPEVDAKSQAQIQKDMEELTLDTRRFPQIVFHSTSIGKAGEGQWKVTGDLSLHGVTKPVTIAVERSGEVYHAHAVLKQTDFGIKPVSVGGGMIKVKNEVAIEFEILARHP